MPIKPNRGENKDEFIGRCIGHEVGKGMDQKQAAAVCYSIWEESLSEHSMRIMFDKNVPSRVINSYLKSGYQCYIWGGNGVFNKQKPAFYLAKASGLNQHNIFWGKLEWVMSNNNINLFMSSDEYWNIDGYIQYYEDKSFNLADEDVSYVIEERWVTNPDQTGGLKSCPICITLEKMNWVPRGQQVEYRWNGESKPIEGLPPYRRAHSIVGGDNWKVSDYYCKCSKQVRSAPMRFNSQEKIVVEIPHTCNHNE